MEGDVVLNDTRYSMFYKFQANSYNMGLSVNDIKNIMFNGTWIRGTCLFCKLFYSFEKIKICEKGHKARLFRLIES